MTTTAQSYEDAVLKTVMWWSEKAFATPMNQNNGDNSSAGGFAFLLMNMISRDAQQSVSKEQIKKFEDKLTELLTLEKRRNPSNSLQLHVDYHPDRILAEACSFAGINPMVLPCKSGTYIDNSNHVMAKYQYGGSYQEL